MRAQIIMNMASKDKYKSLLERYKQALVKNPKLNLSAYCRLNGVSVSGMHHYIEDIGPSTRVDIFKRGVLPYPQKNVKLALSYHRKSVLSFSTYHRKSVIFALLYRQKSVTLQL